MLIMSWIYSGDSLFTILNTSHAISLSLLTWRDFLKLAARSNGQILNTGIYVTAIADGRTRFYGEARLRLIFGFSAYRSQFQT